MAFLSHFLELFLESAPWLLLGLVTAGLIKEFIPSEWLNKQLGGSGLKAIVKSAVFGAPLPLCSCGVIPAAVGLRRSGASKAATTSFLVSTPETGVDSISISYVLLGPFMAIVRPVAAIYSAILAGVLVGKDDEPSVSAPADKKKSTSSCCSSKKEAPVMTMRPVSAMNSNVGVLNPSALNQTMVAAPLIKTPKVSTTAKTSSCCSSTAPAKSTCSDTEQPKKAASQASSCCSSSKGSSSKDGASTKAKSSCCSSLKTKIGDKKSFSQKCRSALKFSATSLVEDTSVWLLVGLGFAALVQAYLPDGFLEGWGSGIVSMTIMVLISIPMYICATASTPIAAGLLLAGVSPGSVLVFMMAGPASNVASLGVVYNELGKRALAGYLGGVLGGAMSMGFLVDYLVTEYGFKVTPQIGPEHELLPHWLTLLTGVILAILIINGLGKKYLMRFVKA